MLALCFEQEGKIEDAYYAYKLTLFLSKGTADEEVIKKEFKRLCLDSGADSYRWGKALTNIIVDRIKLGEYKNTYEFLGLMLGDYNKVAAQTAITEENMLLFMMLEINSCEINSSMDNEKRIFNIYGCDYRLFKNAYLQMKFVFRRIWFGMSYEHQKQLVNVIHRYDISPDMTAIIAKYFIDKECWCDAFEVIAGILEEGGLFLHSSKIKQYRKWLISIGEGDTKKCRYSNDFSNNALVKLLDCKNSICEEVKEAKIDASKIAIIYCTNDRLYDNECQLYLKKLIIPDDMKLEILPVINAKGMAAGYNYAMKYCNAKYKIYIHQDTFIIDECILSKILNVFSKDNNIGMIGNLGTTKLLKSGRWYENSSANNRGNLYQDEILNIKSAVSIIKRGEYEYADAIDGIFIATSKDVKWRDDLFDGWHFYDISQTFEFRKAGYETVFLNDYEDSMALIHETTAKKEPYDMYDKYRRVFLKNYM